MLSGSFGPMQPGAASKGAVGVAWPGTHYDSLRANKRVLAAERGFT